MSALEALTELRSRQERLTDEECISALNLLDDIRKDFARQYRIGIITALAHETAALESAFDEVNLHVVHGVRFKIAIAAKPGSNQERVIAVVRQAGDYGNNMAAVCATEMMACFPGMDSLIMVGIAGGIPDPKNVDRHVRLGDIVVSSQEGVTQYDFGKQEGDQFIERARPRTPSPRLLERVNELKVGQLKGHAPWETFIAKLVERLNWQCPPEETDVLLDDDAVTVIAHPEDCTRKPKTPRVFHGKIASANIVLKSARHRAELRDRFRVCAVEMEASGIADAAWKHERGYLVIRGICDYADQRKDDAWQRYAAIVAAAYCRALLEA